MNIHTRCNNCSTGRRLIEELLPFNEEAVVRAAFNSVISVISAVGHEKTGYTLSDLVALISGFYSCY